MLAFLELDANKDAFDASVKTVADRNPRYKKYIRRVCDDIRELIFSEKAPIVTVYSVRDKTFKMFLWMKQNVLEILLLSLRAIYVPEVKYIYIV